MSEPTQEQRKKLWEKCGFRHQVEDWYEEPNGDIVQLPPIDLNNLFKYAVPNFKYCDLTKPEHKGFNGMWLSQVRDDKGSYHAEDKDPALALFHACDKAREEK